MRILVTDGDTRPALAVTRSLGRRGHSVVVGERHTPSLAHLSKHCAGRIVYPDPARHESGFIESLLEALMRHRVDVVLPITDVTTLVMAEHRRAIEAHSRLPIPPTASLIRAADKAEVVRTALRLGVPVPRTFFVDDAQQAAAAASTLGGRVVVKPRRSRERTPEGWQKSSVSYARDPRDAAREVAALPAGGRPVLLQERLTGEGLGVFMCFADGKPVATFAHKRLREKPPAGGVSVLSQSIAADPATVCHAATLLRDLGWQGVAMVEFKRDDRDGIPKLMEVNGRFWGSLQLAIDAGVDFPAILVDSLFKGPPTAAPRYRLGVKNRWLVGDFDSLLIRLFGHDRSDREGRWQAIADFLRLWESDLYYENPRLDDLRPGLYEVWQWVRQLARGAQATR